MNRLINRLRTTTITASAAVLLLGLSAHGALRPDHVIVVIMQDRCSDAIGNPLFDYVNGLVPSSLVYSNSHGVTHPSEPNSLALYTGSTLGIDDNGRHHTFDPDDTPHLAKSLIEAGLSFTGYSEDLPWNGFQGSEAGTALHPDLYTRNTNPMAQFTSLDDDDDPMQNPSINKTFAAFQALSGNYVALPTVSFVIPNALHSTHGSNEAEPWAGSPDEENNDILRNLADDWLEDEIDPYIQWAKENNSLLILTQDEERWTGGTADTITTLVTGDPALFVPGGNGIYYNHFSLLRTLSEMYGFAPLGESANVAPFTFNAQGQLTVPEPSSATALIVGAAALGLRRTRGKTA